MKKYWDGLRSFEKRVILGFGVLFFVVINFLFVMPHFSDLAATHYRRDEAQLKIAKYQAEISQMGFYRTELSRLEREAGDVAPEDQTFQFANAIQAQAAQSSVQITQNGKINTQTNQFFLERSQGIQIQAGEEHMVDFLYNLGAGESQIRVRGLTVRPDQPRQQLVASVTLVASYQKKSAPRPATAAPAAPARSAAVPPARTTPAASQPTTPASKKP
jgi:type II secretory pathway component PulM